MNEILRDFLDSELNRILGLTEKGGNMQKFIYQFSCDIVDNLNKYTYTSSNGSITGLTDYLVFKNIQHGVGLNLGEMELLNLRILKLVEKSHNIIHNPELIEVLLDKKISEGFIDLILEKPILLKYIQEIKNIDALNFPCNSSSINFLGNGANAYVIGAGELAYKLFYDDEIMHNKGVQEEIDQSIFYQVLEDFKSDVDLSLIHIPKVYYGKIDNVITMDRVNGTTLLTFGLINYFYEDLMKNFLMGKINFQKESKISKSIIEKSLNNALQPKDFLLLSEFELIKILRKLEESNYISKGLVNSAILKMRRLTKQQGFKMVSELIDKMGFGNKNLVGELASQVRNIEVMFNEKGLYLDDFHLSNIMIGESDGNIGAYLIDFGDVTIKPYFYKSIS